MSSTINASSAGIVETADSSGTLTIQTGGQTGVYIDASQNVTIPKNLTVSGTLTYSGGGGAVTTVSGGSTGLTPSTPASGNVVLGGTLLYSSGGTGLTSSGASGNLLVSTGSGWTSSTLTTAGVAPATGSTAYAPITGSTTYASLSSANQFTNTYNYFGGSSSTTSMIIGYGSVNFYSSTIGSNVNTSMFFSATGTSVGAQQFSLSYNNSGTPSSNYQFYGDGTAFKTGSSTAWTNTSDVRLKTNIANYTPGLTQLLQIQPRTWQWNGLAKTTEGADGFGLVADEIQQIVPSMVKTTPMLLNPTDTQTTDIKQVDVTELTWILINSVKELSAKVTALEAKVGV